MKFCPKCGAPINEATPFFCTQCGAQLLIKKVPSIEPTVVGPASAGLPPISPTPITPTPIEPAPIESTAIEPTPIEPTPIEPTPIEPTPIEPTPIEPTPIEPTSIEPTRIEPTQIKPTEIKPTVIKPFVFKTLWINALIAILAAIALAITLNVGLSSFFGWILAILFAFCSAYGLLGLFKEIMKLPINQAVIDQFNSKLKPGKTPVTQSSLTKVQKIQFRLMRTTLQNQAVSLATLGAIALILLISVPAALTGSAAGPTTTITGVWVHELGPGKADTTWVVNVTMWAVDESDPGYVYTNVSENNTFTVTYNDTMVSNGTWEETASNNYLFWYYDPDDILGAISCQYQIRGNDLAQGLGPDSIYCTKQ